MENLKDTELEQMKNIHFWKEITKGLYRYVVSANVCYEIHINICKFDTPVVEGIASLFLVGDWRDKNGVDFFSRECLLEKQSVKNCIEKAIQDYKENMSRVKNNDR